MDMLMSYVAARGWHSTNSYAEGYLPTVTCQEQDSNTAALYIILVIYICKYSHKITQGS